MKKELIKSELKSILSYGVSYNEMLVVLNELINNQKEKVKNSIYEIDLEGDVIFTGSLNQCEDFIKSNRISIKKNKKEYGLSTPTESNIVLCYSSEFSHLFNT
jgi:hypothetical protein